MTRGNRAADIIVLYAHVAAAGEAGVVLDLAFLQRHRRGAHLEYRAGHVGVRDAFVTPHRRERLALFLVLLLLGKLLDAVHLRRRQLIRVVEVVAVGGDHREDRGRVNVHADAARAVHDVVVDDSLRHILFADALDGLVDGEIDVVAVLAFDVLFVLERHIGTAGIFGGDDSARSAREVFVVFVLNALQSLLIRSREADDRGREGVLGIVALVVVEKLNDAAAVVFLGERFHQLDDLVALLHLDFALDDGVVVLLLRLFKDVFVVQPEDLGESSCRSLALLVVVKVDRRKHDLPYRGAFRKRGAFGVVDGTALRREDGVAQLLTDRLLLKLAALNHCQK